MVSSHTDRAWVYEKLYSFKDYEAESKVIRDLLVKRGYGIGSILDVGCGPADHLVYLQKHYDVAGVDLSDEFIARARERIPSGTFEAADMANFDLGRGFDIVISLFSAIGYVKTRERLANAIGCIAKHVEPGGIVLIEPWFEPGSWEVGRTDLTTYESGDAKIARVTRSDLDGDISIFDSRFVVATADGFDEWSDRHELGLFTHDEQISLLKQNGIDAELIDSIGLAGRGLILGTRRV